MKISLLRITMPLSIVAILAVGIVSGCEKKDKLDELSSAVKTQELVANRVTSEADYQSTFEATANMLDEGLSLRIIKHPNGYIFEVVKGQEPGEPINREACRSTSGATISFAQCCRAYVLAEGCVMVTHNGNTWNGGACPGQ